MYQKKDILPDVSKFVVSNLIASGPLVYIHRKTIRQVANYAFKTATIKVSSFNFGEVNFDVFVKYCMQHFSNV